ncbi:phosphotransferase [Nocardioides zeae]|uniref:Phosphotransferase n=1 Tax=Nocardioides imazamoxiresistens TaxID=3231893 RepID=A0ABU3PUL0_9ACTN|nr:phosphotransferase [Nocardioides zeae]MDT9592859.1 phosphotransferase [Nocardioides zeae]
MLLTTDDCDELLALALPAYGMGPAVDVRLLSLSENGTYLVRDDDRVVVARVHRHGYQDAASIRSELAWTDALRVDADVRTPAVVPTLDGEQVVRLDRPEGERHVVLFTYVPGTTAEESPLPVAYDALGALTARMHRQVEDWPRPDGFTRFHWDAAACLGPDARWGSWRDAPGVDAGSAVLAEAEEVVLARLEEYGTGPGRYGLVHADLRLANLMVDDERRLTVIDFDDCGHGWFLYDLAAALSWQEHEAHVPAAVADWLAGYATQRSLGADDLAMVPVFVMLRRLMLTAWLGTHPDSPPALGWGRAYAAGTADLADRFLSDPTWLRADPEERP